MNIVQFNLD